MDNLKHTHVVRKIENAEKSAAQDENRRFAEGTNRR
jgi:hypothetical protein